MKISKKCDGILTANALKKSLENKHPGTIFMIQVGNNGVYVNGEVKEKSNKRINL